MYEKVYISLFQFRVNRHVCDVIKFYDERHFELSTGDVTIKTVVSFSLRFAENMLNMA